MPTWKFIEELFKAAGITAYISDSYKKELFKGKPFTDNLKNSVNCGDIIASLTCFFETQINDAGAVLVELGVPVKDEPNKKSTSNSASASDEITYRERY